MPHFKKALIHNISASNIRGALNIDGCVITIHGINISIKELVKIFELSFDKEKFESMLVAMRITEKDDQDEKN